MRRPLTSMSPCQRSKVETLQDVLRLAAVQWAYHRKFVINAKRHGTADHFAAGVVAAYRSVFGDFIHTYRECTR